MLVDVIAEETKGALHSRELLTGLKAKDFRVFDDGHEVSIRSFDVAEEHTAPPVALWLMRNAIWGCLQRKHLGS